MKKAFIVFARTPEIGRVKTRLMKDLDVEETLKLYKSFVSETFKICDGLKGVDKFLGSFPTTDDPFLNDLVKKYKFKGVFNQKGSDLGEKFINAFNDRFNEGYEKVVIIGSDSPTIPVEYIKNAFQELEKQEFVFGPCTDGGYYLVGARRLYKKVFRGITWDSSEVLNKTLDKLYSGKIKFSLLPFWYDVDDIDDFRFYKRHIRYFKGAGQI
ncbi:MAG: TIGR04282 family arsenosugar biosynthesis glycosyltransferase [Nitrospirae bacterium]|nr:TIGR04282 family arsenosugar biosynthesis glycosyltransferase [Nitrospirota bacterium]